MKDKEYEEYLDRETEAGQVLIQKIKDYFIEENMSPTLVMASLGMILTELLALRLDENGIKIFIDALHAAVLDVQQKLKNEPKERNYSKLRE